MEKKLHLLLILVLVSGYGHAEQDQFGLDIDVVGLFTDAAVLNINGNRQLLRKGERSDEGVTLISANSREAVIEYKGRQTTLNLSSKVGANFQPPSKTSVSIPLNDEGQYRIHGSINDRPVSFVIDTGATIVAMNSDTARRVGVDISEGKPMRAMTAGGDRQSWQVTVDSIQVGGIKVNNVPAAVLEGRHPEDILLGMTFLRNVEMSEKAGLLMLTTEH